MALVVAKTAYSTPVNEGHDMATGLYDRNGKLFTHGEADMPVFVGLGLLTVPEVIRAIGLENMEPEDIYIINDPYVASTHNNDIHIMKPIFHEGHLVAFASSTAHWSDVGGTAPGSLNPRARSHFEEGVRIPALKLFKRGVLDRDIVAILLANMRQSWERLGDLHAQAAAIKAGDKRIQGLIAKYGLDAVLAAMDEIQNYSERLARASFARLPDGTYEVEEKVDQDVWTGEPVTVRLKLTIDGDHAVFRPHRQRRCDRIRDQLHDRRHDLRRLHRHRLHPAPDADERRRHARDRDQGQAGLRGVGATARRGVVHGHHHAGYGARHGDAGLGTGAARACRRAGERHPEHLLRRPRQPPGVRRTLHQLHLGLRRYGRREDTRRLELCLRPVFGGGHQYPL